MTWVKICGISDIESAIAASQAGTDYLGMVFAPSRTASYAGKSPANHRSSAAIGYVIRRLSAFL